MDSATTAFGRFTTIKRLDTYAYFLRPVCQKLVATFATLSRVCDVPKNIQGLLPLPPVSTAISIASTGSKSFSITKRRASHAKKLVAPSTYSLFCKGDAPPIGFSQTVIRFWGHSC